MLSQIDNIIFPDRCDVLEVDSQRYIYPIFKNGSSALNKVPHRIVEVDELTSTDIVDVFVRDPYQRFLSGVQTFLRYNTQLHRETMLHFISECLFLNRHFCPQFHWLVNLKRHTHVKMRLLPMSELCAVVGNVTNHYTRDPELVRYFENNPKVHFYLQLDKVLTENLLGQTVTLGDIVAEIAQKYPEVYREVIGRSLNLCTVLD